MHSKAIVYVFKMTAQSIFRASYAAAPLGAAKWLVKIWIYKNASL